MSIESNVLHSDADIDRGITDIVAEALALDASQFSLNSNSNLLELGLDSTSAVEVFLLMERAFGITIDGSELSTELLENYGQLKAWVQQKLAH